VIFNIQNLLRHKSKNIENFPTGIKFFNIGVFLLVSAPAIAGLFFLTSIILSSLNSKLNYFQDKSNKIFIIISILLISTTFINHFFHSNNDVLSGYQTFVNWIGILNWIPYFYCYWAFQKFLNTSVSRKNTAINLVSGSIPLLITSVGQYWFDWHGPFKTLNGLIIWFQRPISSGDGVTGLFNNSNYAGSWLVIIFPFIIAFMYQITNSRLQRFVISILISLVSTLIYISKSRNALLGSILSLQLLYQSKPIFIILIFLGLFIFSLTTLNESFKKLFIGNYLTINLNFESFSRLNIYKESINFILERPILGWGSASFPLLFFAKKYEWLGHSHNIFLELAINYGLISATLIGFVIFSILFRSFKSIYLLKTFKGKTEEKENSYLDKAWWTATMILLFSQFFDIQFFDFRIGMIFWILLSGLSKIKSPVY
tara:strand:+ start:436 stop:1722 length:1287 start_codon:yes stop_codon:yes gene_type:complete